MMTGAGVILGTAAYMSPEQARGKPVDKLTDVWAFGCVLYEMLTATRAFAGHAVTDTLAAIVRDEPDWSKLPPDTPTPIRRLLRRCLAKDRTERASDIGLARLEISDALAARRDDEVPDRSPRPARTRSRIAWSTAAVALALAAIALAATRWESTSRPAPPVTRFSIPVPSGVFSTAASAGPIAISADGTQLAYLAQTDTGGRQIFVRRMDRLEARPLRETEGAGFPVFSPDGRWIAYFDFGDANLKKVPIGGGAPSTIYELGVGSARGFAWAADGTLLVSLPGGLFRVPERGGTPTQVTRLESGELSHRWPEILPGGKVAVFTIQRTADFNGAAIGAVHLDTGERRVLLEGGTFPHYIPDGRLVFARGAALLAVPFDVGRLSVSGAEVPVIEHITMSAAQGHAQVAVSRTGTLAYVTALEDAGRSIVWVNRRGDVQPIEYAPRNFEQPRLSPDGKQLAVDIRGYAGSSTTDLWLYQFANGTLSRLTFDYAEAEAPVWTPDGSRIAYAVGGLTGRPARGFAWKPADAGGVEELLVRGDAHLHPKAWNPTGTVLIANESVSKEADIWALFMNEGNTLRPLTKTRFSEVAPALSPDGRWLAYASNETGRYEVYAQAFPGPGGKSQISRDGGAEPVWARDGRELFYRNGDKMMVVPVVPGAAVFATPTPALLFDGHFATAPAGDQWYDVSPDGQRFIMLKISETLRSTAAITVVQRWSTELEQMVPLQR
jgi:serine/threonine-protein kinase